MARLNSTRTPAADAAGWSLNGWLTDLRDAAGRPDGGLQEGCVSWVP
jgi:hypothetical protein